MDVQREENFVNPTLVKIMANVRRDGADMFASVARDGEAKTVARGSNRQKGFREMVLPSTTPDSIPSRYLGSTVCHSEPVRRMVF